MRASIRSSTLLLALALLAAPALAEEAPWTLDANDWQQAKDLLPAPVLERIKKGDYTFKVVPVDPAKFRANYSAPFWQASAANAGKYDLAPDICGLADKKTGEMPDFFFGLPFPTIDPADPRAGCKIAWNFTAATAQGDGGGATFTISGIDDSGEYRRLKLSVELMTYVGRHGGPIDNPQHLRAKGMVFLHEPQDLDGVSFLAQRKNDWHSDDLIWAYVPSTRRARRVSSATRSDPIAGLDLYADDANCYAGKIEYFKWRLVGEGRVLAPVLAPYALPMHPESATRFRVDVPPTKAAFETPGAKGVPWAIVDGVVYVPRPVWIVEGEAADPNYNFAKVVFYFDKELYQIHWKLVFNKAGEYFYNAACVHHFAKNADDTFSAVANSLVVGVNDKTNRAAFGGRYSSQFLERAFDADHFSLVTLQHAGD
jgi:Protein of unknown function (DUF1329)